MSAVDLSFRVADYVRFLADLLSGKRQRSEYGAAQRRARECQPYLSNKAAPLTILDVGSGKLRPQYTILRRQGHRVIGVDLANAARLSVESVLYVFARFLYELGCPAKGQAKFPHELIAADVGNLPIPDSSVDLVTSVAAFEHFLDVPKVVAELHRVTKPRGVLWIAIHPFRLCQVGIT
jgi:SAM-dependent methyltransferase